MSFLNNNCIIKHMQIYLYFIIIEFPKNASLVFIILSMSFKHVAYMYSIRQKTCFLSCPHFLSYNILFANHIDSIITKWPRQRLQFKESCCIQKIKFLSFFYSRISKNILQMPDVHYDLCYWHNLSKSNNIYLNTSFICFALLPNKVHNLILNFPCFVIIIFSKNVLTT